MSSVPAPIPFSKPWLSYSNQVQLLESRGLVVADRAFAEHFLAHLNYYRFSGYCLAFETARHRFVPGTTFEQVIKAYEFDLALRDLLTEGLEAIEVDLRATTAYHFGRLHGAFGHAEPAKFFAYFRHAPWLAQLQAETDRSQELFVTHFKRTYSDYPDLPVWIATEVMSFGCLSKMIAGMQKPDAKALASRYGLQPNAFQAVTHHFTYVRNLCAHHSRIWDRLWSIKPVLPAGKNWTPPLLTSANGRLFSTLLLMRVMMKASPALSRFASEWQARVSSHLHSPPASVAPLQKMGLTPNWAAHPLWV